MDSSEPEIIPGGNKTIAFLLSKLSLSHNYLCFEENSWLAIETCLKM